MARELRVLRAIFVKDMRQAFRYPAYVAMLFLLPFFFALLFTSIGTFMGGPNAAAYFAEKTGTRNIATYQLLGGAVWILSWMVIDRIGSSLREERTTGTLEQTFLAPISRFLFLISKALAVFVTCILIFLSVVVLSTILFNPGSAPGLFEAFLVLVLGLVPLLGIGFIFAGLVVRFKEPYAFVNIMTLLFSILVGTYYPVTVLPHWAQYASMMLPQTYALDAIRQILLGGNALVSLDETFIVLSIMAIAYPLVGYWVFRTFLDRSAVNGDLSRF